MNPDYQARQWYDGNPPSPQHYGGPAYPAYNPAWSDGHPAYQEHRGSHQMPAWRSDLHEVSVQPYEGDGLPQIPYQDVAILHPRPYNARNRQRGRGAGARVASVSLFVTGMTAVAALGAYYVLSCYGLF